MVHREGKMCTHSPLTDKQRSAIGGMVYMAFREIRILSWRSRSEQAADLADAILLLPLHLFRPEFDWQIYEKKM